MRAWRWAYGRINELEYHCARKRTEVALPTCQRIPGDTMDRTISQLIIESVNPLALEVALSVQKELQTRLEEADRLRQAHVERGASRRHKHSVGSCASTAGLSRAVCSCSSLPV